MNFSDPDRFRERITNALRASDEDYYRLLVAGEAQGFQTRITTDMILGRTEGSDGRGLSWLDIGCGSGYLLAQAALRGYEVVGVEPGGWGRIAAEAKKVHIVAGPLTQKTFEGTFDVVTATDVLEHQPDPHAFLDLIRHYLARNGRSHMSFPWAGSPRRWMQGPGWSMILPPTHCQFFTRRSFTRLAREHGLETVKFQVFNSDCFRGYHRLGLPRAAANRIASAFGWSDQALVTVCHAVDCGGVSRGNDGTP